MSRAAGVVQARAGSVLPQVAGAIGNVLEWYDFAAYGFLAATFAGNFFPSENHLLSLMASYGVFAIAFVTRPLGTRMPSDDAEVFPQFVMPTQVGIHVFPGISAGVDGGPPPAMTVRTHAERQQSRRLV
jgi:hypothetical protein